MNKKIANFRRFTLKYNRVKKSAVLSFKENENQTIKQMVSSAP